jgi:alcohol dehydrogenase
MIELPKSAEDTLRNIGLSPIMRAAGVVTGMLPIPQPVLLVGPGSSRRLGEAIAGFGHRRVMVVTDKVVAGLGLHAGLVEALQAGGVEHVLYDGVSPDAPIPEIERGVEIYRDNRCQALVAVGGGSPMDASKVIAAAVANDKNPRKLVGYFKGLKTPEPIYAVPTTAGTGSEVTVAAVISDLEAGKKYVVADTRLVPQMAALDPSLMTGLPAHVTAATGMDALTHATEAYLGKWASDHTDRLALAAVRMIYTHLRTACRHGQNLDAREQMSLAATYAGLAFTRANVGYVHAIAHQLGGRYHVPHGLANAIILPEVLKFLYPAVTKRLADLAIRAGVGKPGEKETLLAKRFIESVEEMNRDIGIPGTVKELREEDIPAIAKDACKEADTNYPVPRYMSRETCEELLRRLLPSRHAHKDRVPHAA